MADQNPLEGSNSSDVSAGSSESTVELNIKTLDSQIYGFSADKNMPVSAFKEKISCKIGVPVQQQRLIFRGKVLKDDHLLSEYYLENGDTLHLVLRQASQSASSSSSGAADANASDSGRGQEPGINGPRGRVGQISSHSVVLGTFNVGEHGGPVMPNLGRVIGAVLNSIGIGNQNGAQPGLQFNAQVQPPQRSGTEGTGNDAGAQSQAGNQSQPWQSFSGQSLPQVVQIPVGAAIAIPSLNMPIPDSLNTLSEFINRMELALSQHGNQPTQSPPVAADSPTTTELPTSSRGVPTPEALRIVLQQAQCLLGGSTVESLSHIAGRLEQDAGSSDPTVRGQIQSETTQVGLAMQHLGALLLELGRTMLTLRMGQSPAESSVNAGPAVYISPSGPNPIMVQPFPLQASSLFGSSAANPSNLGPIGPVGIGNIPRHVNIHIHTGASMSPIVSGIGVRTSGGDGPQGERAAGTVSGDSGQSQAQPVRNVVAAAVPSRPADIAVSGTLEPTIGVSQPPSEPFHISAVIPEVNSQIRNVVDNMRNEHQLLTGQSESLTVQERSIGTAVGSNGTSSHPSTSSNNEVGVTSVPLPGISKMEDTASAENLKPEPSSSLGGASQQSIMAKTDNEERRSTSSQSLNAPEGSSTAPLGLGFGRLLSKRCSKLSKSERKKTGVGSSTASGQTEQPGVVEQQVLQSLASLATRNNANIQPPGQVSRSDSGNSLQSREQNADGQFDVATAMSQLVQNPALTGLLTGVSQQTGIGSPDALRNMLGQITQNPTMRNTVNQLAQQIDEHDLGNMFSGMAGGPGGGFDLSRMMQQMMPIVSQALGGLSTSALPTPALRPDLMESRSRSEVAIVDESSQVNLQEVAQRIEQCSPPGEIFNSLIRIVASVYEGGNEQESVLNMLSSEEELAAEFAEMLHNDITSRLKEEFGP